MHAARAIFSLRYSLFAALGLGALGCGADVSTTSSGSQGGGGAGGASTSSQSSGSGVFVGCMGAMPVLLPDGTDSGYVRCADGTIHRETAVACDTTINAPSCAGTESFMDCKVDADCVAKPHGKCAHFDPQFGAPGDTCGCVYSCAEDAECGTGQVCACNGVVNNGVTWSVCTSSALCKTDADCPTGECGITSFNDGCFQQVGLACRSAGDICRVDTDCMAGFSCVTVANPLNPSSTPFSCETQNCAIGRPLLVSGHSRTAQARDRNDWADTALKPDLESLDPALRSSLEATWTEIAGLEHASIASFARFSLSLLALGAPPELLSLTQEAAADEVEHARIAYSLASHYAGRSIGPSCLVLDGVTIETEKRAVLASLIEEACVGETLGAAEALSLSFVVTDPALRAAYTRIAEDESRHAQLAWKTLRFLLEGADITTKRFVEEVFAAAAEAASQGPSGRKGVISDAHGLLSPRVIAGIRKQALRDVVRPLAQSFLAPKDESPTSSPPVSNVT